MKNKEIEILKTRTCVKGKLYIVDLDDTQNYSRVRKLWLSMRTLKESLHNKAVKAICDYKVKQILTAINSYEQNG